MKKTTRQYTSEVVVFHTSLPFGTVITRLDKAINKEGSQTFLTRFIEKVKQKEDFGALIKDNLGEHGFLCVGSL